MKRATGLTIALFAFANAAVAEPCVSDTFDQPLDGAVGVVTRHADVPSPQFPGLWQEGTLDGYFYTLYANGEGSVKAQQRLSDWEVRVLCPEDGTDCSVDTTGTPPEPAYQVADRLSLCLRNITPPEPEPDPVVPPKPEETSQEPEVVSKPDCGLETVEDGTEAEVLQRLLVAAGADPGPVDGFVGSKTNDALAGILGQASVRWSLADAIAALDVWMCDNQE